MGFRELAKSMISFEKRTHLLRFLNEGGVSSRVSSASGIAINAILFQVLGS